MNLKVIVFLCNVSVCSISYECRTAYRKFRVIDLHIRVWLVPEETMDIAEELKRRTNGIQTITMHTAGEVGR